MCLAFKGYISASDDEGLSTGLYYRITPCSHGVPAARPKTILDYQEDANPQDLIVESEVPRGIRQDVLTYCRIVDCVSNYFCFLLTFGVEFDDACSTPKEAAKFGPAFDKANYLPIQHYVNVLWPIKKRLNIGSEATLKKCVEITDHVVYKLIERRSQEMRQSQDSTSVTRYDILSRFLYSGETDPKNLRDSTLSFVIPSRDATSATLAWFFYMLCKQPELQEKLAQEIKNVTKVESAADIIEFAENLSDEHLEKMHYLHALLTETLRLYPAVPMDVKMCFSDDTLPDGYKSEQRRLGVLPTICHGTDEIYLG
ncbi:hypothetical protein Droror1_Dr00027400 [Drosera rotundifolia]